MKRLDAWIDFKFNKEKDWLVNLGFPEKNYSFPWGETQLEYFDPILDHPMCIK
jgi:hypothetical protein